jgi:hypothetical protein
LLKPEARRLLAGIETEKAKYQLVVDMKSGTYYCGFTVSHSAWNMGNQCRFFCPGRDKIITFLTSSLQFTMGSWTRPIMKKSSWPLLVAFKS